MNRTQIIESLLKIQDKERQTVPMRLNTVQKHFMENKTKRNIILKARQLGVSSLILADMFLEAITVPNTTCVVVSHEQHATERLLAKVHFYYNNLPVPEPPEVHHMSASEMSFPKMNSTIYIGTARSMSFGRGDRIDRAHLSELAYYDDGERIVNAVEEAVPLNGEITIECSPNGEGNQFHDMWIKAANKKSGYKSFFYPWWLGEDYQIPQGSPLALEPDRGVLRYSGEELELKNMFQVTDEQLRWRRRKIADKGGLFYQEYPEDEVNCFLTSGDPVFDPEILLALTKGCYEGRWHPAGFQIWLEPAIGTRYMIGADCSSGYGASYSAASVISERHEVVATFQAKLEPEAFAEVLKVMGKYYNNAELAVERNAQGYAVLSHLSDYGNLYHQLDYATGMPTGKLGWWTSEPSKVFMMTKFKEWLPTLKCWDIELIRQARGYRYVRLQPTPQTEDDLLFGTMIAIAALTTIGTSRGFVGQVQYSKW